MPHQEARGDHLLSGFKANLHIDREGARCWLGFKFVRLFYRLGALSMMICGVSDIQHRQKERQGIMIENGNNQQMKAGESPAMTKN
jgi:hypothetical protein